MRTRAITTAEYRTLLRTVPQRTQIALRIMADTGLRISDVLELTVGQIARTMHVRESKTGHVRTVHLTTRTLAACRAYAARRPAAARLIPHDRSTIYRDIRRAADRRKWSHVSAHSLRKYYAQRYCRRHGLAATQAELQHRDTITTLIYVVDRDRLEDMIHGYSTG